ncbi:chemotaxis protein CheB [Flavobacterium akiainvivens]|uniref:protein-glutamate methylesterase n=1 Tax=Flavobacterium akiainvivens TaxID=1202724 RepID=A0A0M8MHT2_9FLAO|nr:chemotaxis protein CheB [Flavobacterium akiainvivens]KOS05868.1 chemotaxis protein CheB [Flavobacterium akiainvivens]SFQ56544.1 CheB methylesterase [Flavobacterium akiainvivens]
MEKNKVTPAFKALLIGGSAGSLEVMLSILPALKPLPDYAVVIVLHRKNSEDNTLEELFTVRSAIPVNEVDDKTQLMPGYMYIAPAGYHLLFEANGELSLDASEKIHYSRPSIDVAFESAAEVFGNRLTAVLLSGANADGAQGLVAVKEKGGTVVVQDPLTADMPMMPQSALNVITPDFLLKTREILPFVNNLN